MPTKELPFAPPGVPEIQPQPVSVLVHALIHAWSVVAAEIALDIADDFGAAIFVLDHQVEARILRRSAKFADISLRGVAEGYRGKRRGDVALRVGCAEDILEIDESSGSQDCVTDLETLDWRLRLFLILLSWLLPDIGCCVYRGRLN